MAHATSALVLGGGMVGSVMAADMAAAGLDVCIADISEGNLASARARAERWAQRRTEKGAKPGAVTVAKADLSDGNVVTRLATQATIVCGALSSRIGLRAMRAVIEAGRNYCDISFMAEDPTDPALGLDALAKSRGVTVVYDFGVAPGMSHLLAAHGAARLDSCERIEIYVGGLPRVRRWPYEYKAAFAPSDVIEEYTRPARLVERGEVVTREALSEPELMDFPGAGTLEAFNTDGLRSLCATHLGKVPWMKEKTLRYPGHIELMRVLRATGLFDEAPVDVRGADGTVHKVVPLELTAKLMFPKWTYEPGEEDLTVMRVLAAGTRGGKPESLQWDLFDVYNQEMQATSMARTTALPCTILARMVAAGRCTMPGVNPPEAVAMGPAGAARVGEIMSELASRGVTYTFKEE